MRHFVAYHNRDKMGEHSRPFQAYTNKTIHDLQDNVVWVVEGLGRSPKQYNLVSWFIVRNLERSPHEAFKIALYGDDRNNDRHRYEFKERIRLNEFDWFSDFRRRMGNFGFGLQPVTDDEIVSHLNGVAKLEGRAPV
jgi:hypothetical protein